MRRHVLLVTLLAVFALSVIVTTQQQARELYQRALSQENVAGNLDEAIALYRQSAQAAGGDRALAARALVRAGGASERLGRFADATQLYADAIRFYPEQRREIAAAQERLTALRRQGRLPTPVRSGDVSAVVAPVFDRYCVRCHDAATRAGGLDLATLDPANIARNTATWEHVLRRFVARREPPANAPRPADATYRTVIARLGGELDAVYATNRALTRTDRVDGNELAVRLARFIWNAEPDASLRADAANGRLHERAVLDRQVLRMLRDAKSAGLRDGFLAGWLSLDRIRQVKPDPSRFPGADAELLRSMDTEVRLFLQEQLRDDRDPMELWTANYSYVDPRLARHYGLAGVAGPDFRRITWPDDRRGGLLGQSGILTAWSMSARTSPTQRGRFVLSTFFGLEPPSPPANVPPMVENPPRGATLRDRLRVHKVNPSCASCHSMFDPIGLSLENFDGIGTWRTTDNGSPIDASGTFLDGTRFEGPAGLRAALRANRDAYYTGLTERLLAYALNRQGKARQVYDFEMSTVRAIVRRGEAEGYRWSTLIAGIAASAPFQTKNTVP